MIPKDFETVLDKIKGKILEPCGAGIFCDGGDCCAYKGGDLLDIVDNARLRINAEKKGKCTMTDWISTDDKMPESTPCLGYDCFYGRIDVAMFGCTGQLIFEQTDDCLITHWMPLPEPPEESTP